jgi:hypothetical protein
MNIPPRFKPETIRAYYLEHNGNKYVYKANLFDKKFKCLTVFLWESPKNNYFFKRLSKQYFIDDAISAPYHIDLLCADYKATTLLTSHRNSKRDMESEYLILSFLPNLAELRVAKIDNLLNN